MTSAFDNPAIKLRTAARSLSAIGIALAALTTAGCDVTENRPGVTTIRIWSMWTGDEEAKFEAVLHAYERTHPGIAIDNLGAVDDPKTIRAIVAGAPPDIATITDPSLLGTLAANGALEPLDARFRSSGLTQAQFAHGSLEQCEYHGHLYGLPYLMDCIGLLYNKDVFRAAGLDQNRPPHTFEEMVQDCARITTRSADGRLTRIGLRPLSEMPPAGVFPLFGGTLVDSTDTHVTPDTPDNLRALKAYSGLMQAQGGYEAVQAFASGFGNNAGAFNPFYHGDVGMYVSGEWNPAWIAQYSPNTHYDVAPLPYAADHPEKAGTVWLGDNIFVIPRGARRQKEAWDFMVWMQSPEAQRMFALSLHNVPNIRSELNDPALRAGSSWQPYFGHFLDLAESPNATAFPTLPVANLYTTELGNAFDSVLYGSKSPEQALIDVQHRVQPEMDKYER